MHHHTAGRLASLALILLVVAACGDDTTGTDGTDLFDVVAVADQVDALVIPLQPTLEPSVSLRSAFDYLQQQGVTFDLQLSPLVERTRVLAGLDVLGLAQSVDFPPEVIGQVFVYNPVAGEWEADPEREGQAPPDGVRVIWYSTGTDGQIGLPLVERGYIDLTDQDEGILSQMGVRIVDTTGAEDLVLADFTQGYWTEGDVEWSEHFEAAGFYADGVSSTTFDLTSDATGSDATGDQDLTFDISLTGESDSYTMGLAISDDGATGAAEESYTVTAIVDGATTRLELDLSIAGDGSQAGTGTIFHQSTSVVEIVVNGTSFQYSPTTGDGSFSDTQIGSIDILVQTMLQDGFIVLLYLPLLFL